MFARQKRAGLWTSAALALLSACAAPREPGAAAPVPPANPPQPTEARQNPPPPEAPQKSAEPGAGGAIGGIAPKGTGGTGGSRATGASGESAERDDAAPAADKKRENQGSADSAPKPEAREPERARPPLAPPAGGGVKAGAADDNLAFGAFLEFLKTNPDLPHQADISDRVVVRVHDRAGAPLANSSVELIDGAVRARRVTYADGRTLLFPSEHGGRSQNSKLRAKFGAVTREVSLDPNSHRVEIGLDLVRPPKEPIPLDVAFVLDTTCSMGDEIDRLKQTLEAIHFQITHFSPRPDVRFGMVLFRDRGDDYRARAIPFTGDVNAFRRELNQVEAGGGGDIPEDVEEGLRVALETLEWRGSGARIAFLVGDAPPHFDYPQSFHYAKAMQTAAARGIKIAAIGASGLDRTAETVWRRLAQYTMAPFVFLTHGESGDSEGSPSRVSHHVGSNWVAENLDAIVVRMLKLELSHFGQKAAPIREDYFDVTLTPEDRPDELLEELFAQSTKQLVDYAIVPIDPRTPTVVLPIKARAKKHQALRAKLEGRLELGLSRSRAFQLVEQAQVPALMALIRDQSDQSYDETKWLEVGKRVPAKLAVFGDLAASEAGRCELLIKLVRLETGEILSLSLLKLDEKLLL